ncbi:hypothetical protein FXO37_14170 [Capsicum annuum]|nr:hypothetical protein FXO37_14170 [Capsicum annuum]
MKTPVFKPIQTRQTSSSKIKKGKQTARVIFPQVHSKPNIHVEEVALSKPESHVEKKTFISKKDFDEFRDEEQVVDIEADIPNVDEEGLGQSRQHFSPDVVQSSDNISNGTKQKHTDKDPDIQNMDYVGTERSPQRLSSEVDQKLKANLLGTKTSDEKIDEIILSGSQFTIPGEMLPSLYAYQIQSIIIHPSANRQEEFHHENLDAKTSETVIEDHSQMNRGITDLSSKSLMNSEVELATEEQVRTPPNTQEERKSGSLQEGKIRNSKDAFGVETVEDKNWFYMMGFADHTWTDSHIDVCLYYLRKKLKYGPHSSYKNEPNKSYKYSTVDCNFMNIIRSLKDVYSMDHQNLNAGGQEHYLIEYINGSTCMLQCHGIQHIFLYDSYEFGGHYAAVLAEIEKIVKIILLCLQACDFYVKKGIDLQNHSRYKDKEFSDMFDVLFEDDLPQQPSGSLDCGVFMVMYAECISYSHKVIAIEFDPNALRTRYAALLWDYGIQKQEANAISDAKAPLRPARQSRITSVTEVVDV